MKHSFIALLVLLFISDANALSCYEQSPNFIALGDKYYNVDDTIKLSMVQEKRLRPFIKKIKGDWGGQSTEIECKGPDRLPITEVNRANSNVVISTASDGTLSLKITNAYHNNGARRKNKSKMHSFLLSERMYIFKMNGSEFTTWDKYRRTSPSGSQLVEVMSKIESGDNGLKVTLNHYSNGVFVYQQKLNLLRP